MDSITSLNNVGFGYYGLKNVNNENKEKPKDINKTNDTAPTLLNKKPVLTEDKKGNNINIYS